MEIELTREQIDLIANAVVRRGGAGFHRGQTCVRRDGSGKRRPVVMIGIGDSAGGRRPAADCDMNLLLTVRSDLAAVVQAIRNGSQKHALELSEHLLGHVEEVLAER